MARENQFSLDRYQEAVDYLCREMDIAARRDTDVAGRFKQFDTNNSGSINAKEFYAKFDVVAEQMPGRYYENHGFIYQNVQDAAAVVFSEGRQLYLNQMQQATSPEYMGKKAREAVDPYIRELTDFGKSVFDWGRGVAPLGQKFVKGFFSSAEQSVDGNDNGWVTRDEAYKFGMARAEKAYPDMPKEERQKNVTLYLDLTFGKKTKLSIGEYHKNLDAIDPDLLEKQKNSGTPEATIPKAEPVVPGATPEMQKKIKEAVQKRKGSGSSVEIEPMLPIALQRQNDNTLKMS